MRASRQGHTDCVRLLVEGGAEKEAKDNVRFVFCVDEDLWHLDRCSFEEK